MTVAFCSPEGLAYYLPALARLTLAAAGPNDAWYGDQLFVHLERDGKRNDRWQYCTPEQRRAKVVDVLSGTDAVAALGPEEDVAKLLWMCSAELKQAP